MGKSSVKKKQPGEGEPEPPKRYLTAYNIFCSRKKDSVPGKESLDAKEIYKALGAMWRNASDDEKEEYKKLAVPGKTKWEKVNATFKRKRDLWLQSKQVKSALAPCPKKAKTGSLSDSSAIQADSVSDFSSIVDISVHSALLNASPGSIARLTFSSLLLSEKEIQEKKKLKELEDQILATNNALQQQQIHQREIEQAEKNETAKKIAIEEEFKNIVKMDVPTLLSIMLSYRDEMFSLADVSKGKGHILKETFVNAMQTGGTIKKTFFSNYDASTAHIRTGYLAFNQLESMDSEFMAWISEFDKTKRILYYNYWQAFMRGDFVVFVHMVYSKRPSKYVQAALNLVIRSAEATAEMDTFFLNKGHTFKGNISPIIISADDKPRPGAKTVSPIQKKPQSAIPTAIDQVVSGIISIKEISQMTTDEINRVCEIFSASPESSAVLTEMKDYHFQRLRKFAAADFHFQAVDIDL